MSNEQQTEDKILIAAMRVFSRKGFTGARMQEIADEAGINKAALHYYFRSKKLLFERIFNSLLQRFISNLSEHLNAAESVEDKIIGFCNTYISMIQKNPQVPNFLINELNQNPQYIFNLFNSSNMMDRIRGFQEAYEKEVKEGKYREMDIIQLMANIISLCVFPFAAKPIMQFNFSLDEDAYQKFIEDRKKLLPEFILNSIKLNKE